MTLKLNLLILLLLLSNIALAQTDSDQIEFSAIEGIKIFTPNNFSIQGKIQGGELGYHFNMADKKVDYVKLLGINSIDVMASYRSLESLTINNDPTTKGSLGGAYSVIGQLEIQLAKAGPVKLLFTPGFGFVYSTVSYFSNKNPLVGSHVNFAAQAGMKIFTTITPSTGVQAGADLFHYSDGGARVPNNGINSLNVSFGIVQNINRSGPSTSSQPFEYDSKSAFEFGFDVGRRGVYDSKAYLYRSGLYAGYSYGLNKVFRLKAGLDAGYYFTPYNINKDPTTGEGFASSYARVRLGVSAGGDLNLGRLTVMASYGYYLYFYSVNPVHTYWTPGLKYYVLPWMAIQGKVYIHSNQADYLGVGLLFRIH
jgi:hypothetical protein